jgi:hypothetical protein
MAADGHAGWLPSLQNAERPEERKAETTMTKRKAMPRRPPQRRQPMPKRRPGYVYAFWGYDPFALLRGTIRIVLLYVGQTRQKPETRWRQHQFGSPNGEPAKIWWPLVTRKTVIYSSVFIHDVKLDRKEVGRILKMRPIMNDQWNRLNPKRIPKYDHAKVMARIDAAGGVEALVDRAQGRHRTAAGWTIQLDEKGKPTGNVTWYGSDAERIGTMILERADTPWESCESPLTGSYSSSEQLGEDSSGSTLRKLASGITALVRG